MLDEAPVELVVPVVDAVPAVAAVPVLAAVPVVAAVPAVAAVPVVAAVPAVAAVVGVDVVVVVVVGLLEVVALAATPAGWVITNWVRAASSDVNNLPPWTEPLPESESPSSVLLLKDGRGVASKDERLIVEELDTAFVDIMSSRLKITRMRGVGAPW